MDFNINRRRAKWWMKDKIARSETKVFPEGDGREQKSQVWKRRKRDRGGLWTVAFTQGKK
jgi:hypothetical protein